MTTTNNKISFRLDGCLYIVLLCALCGIAINECNRSKIRLERDKIEYKQMAQAQDSIMNAKQR